MRFAREVAPPCHIDDAFQHYYYSSMQTCSQVHLIPCLGSGLPKRVAIRVVSRKLWSHLPYAGRPTSMTSCTLFQTLPHVNRFHQFPDRTPKLPLQFRLLQCAPDSRTNTPKTSYYLLCMCLVHTHSRHSISECLLIRTSSRKISFSALCSGGHERRNQSENHLVRTRHNQKRLYKLVNIWCARAHLILS